MSFLTRFREWLVQLIAPKKQTSYNIVEGSSQTPYRKVWKELIETAPQKVIVVAKPRFERIRNIMKDIDWAGVFWYSVGVMIVASLLYLFGRIIFSSGRVQYCYIDSNREELTIKTEQGSQTTYMEKFHLHGARDWYSDRSFGSFNSLEEASEAASKQGCDLDMRKH